MAWQKSQILALQVYDITRDLKDFGFSDQIRRAIISVSNNIAEGFERRTDNEFRHFLFIAKGSAGEVRSMLYLARNLKYFGDIQVEGMLTEILIVSKMISALIKTLK